MLAVFCYKKVNSNLFNFWEKSGRENININCSFLLDHNRGKIVNTDYLILHVSIYYTIKLFLPMSTINKTKTTTFNINLQAIKKNSVFLFLQIFLLFTRIYIYMCVFVYINRDKCNIQTLVEMLSVF
jgi:hypothetical protein